MRVIFLSKGLTIGLCFILWLIILVSSTIFCFKLPDGYFSNNSFIFKERKWEKGGLLYENLFRVRRWKRFLPDGGAVIKNGYKKKHLSDYSKEGLEKFVIESCRAEMTHLLPILPFWVFGFFTPPRVIFYMLIYAVAFNLPCIITQRYNRPRFIKLLKIYYLRENIR